MRCAVAQACTAASNSRSCGGGCSGASGRSNACPSACAPIGLASPACGGGAMPLRAMQPSKIARSSCRSGAACSAPAACGRASAMSCSCAQACSAANVSAFGGGPRSARGGGISGAAPQRPAQPPRLSAASIAVVTADSGRVWTIANFPGWMTAYMHRTQLADAVCAAFARGDLQLDVLCICRRASRAVVSWRLPAPTAPGRNI